MTLARDPLQQDRRPKPLLWLPIRHRNGCAPERKNSHRKESTTVPSVRGQRTRLDFSETFRMTFPSPCKFHRSRLQTFRIDCPCSYTRLKRLRNSVTSKFLVDRPTFYDRSSCLCIRGFQFSWWVTAPVFGTRSQEDGCVLQTVLRRPIFIRVLSSRIPARRQSMTLCAFGWIRLPSSPPSSPCPLYLIDGTSRG